MAVFFIFYDDTKEMVDPNITLNVQRTWRTNESFGDLTPVSDKLLQIVEVNVTNLNEESSFLVSVPHFYAITDEGDEIWVFNGEDYIYDPIEPGQNQTVVLVFHIHEDVILVELQYDQKLTSSVVCDIPPL
jgi:hypothetical protein